MITARNENNSSVVPQQSTFKLEPDFVKSYIWQGCSDNTVGLSVQQSTDPSNIPALTHWKWLVMFCVILRVLVRKICLFHLPQFCDQAQFSHATD